MFSPCSRLTDLYQSRLVRKSPAGDWCQRFRPTNLHYSKALWPLIVLSLRLWLGLLPAAGNVGRLARTHPAMHAEQPARKACQHPSPLDITRQLHWTDLNVRSGQLQAKFEVMIKLVCCSLPPSRADVRPIALWRSGSCTALHNLCPAGGAHGTCDCRRPLDAAALIWGDKGTWALLSRARAFFWGDKSPIPRTALTDLSMRDTMRPQSV